MSAAGSRLAARATEVGKRIVETAAWALAALLSVSLAAGLTQAAVMLGRHMVNGSIIFQSRELLWMTPAGYLLILTAVAVPLLLLMLPLLLAGRADSARRIFAGTLVFLGAFGLALLIPRLHVVAQLILAAGVAVRLSGALARQSTRSLAITGASLAALTLLIGGGGHTLRELRAARQLAALPPAAQGAPNVLLIILDTVRGANMSFYGYARNTMPALARRADEGALFEYAFSPASWTAPSHSSMFTGITPSHIGMSWRTWETALPDSLPTLAEIFRDHGYATGGFVANLFYTAWDSGLNRGFIQYRDHRRTLTQVVSSAMLGQTPLFRYLWWSRSRRDLRTAFDNFSLAPPRMLEGQPKPAPVVSNEFLDWQETVEGRPFFAFLNYFDAHGPYRAPRQYMDQFGPDSVPLNRYDAAIRYLDDELDRVFRTLEERGVLDNTIVIVTSDHGEEFGERGAFGHGHSVHTQLVRVPLVLRHPATVPAGLRIEDAVSLRDLGATLLELAGIGEGGFPGISFASTWMAPQFSEVRAPALSETTATPDTITRGRISRSAAADGLHLIRWLNDSEELYDYQRDPDEVQPLSVNDPAYAEEVAALRAALLETERQAVPPRP